MSNQLDHGDTLILLWKKMHLAEYEKARAGDKLIWREA